ncbi:MAG TPA: CusA/CzcA family heavy metal efflux RND transporter [Acidiferrobacteraceae bacterium]|nr:CusA/CzcA family heavy metal efflux RND transporter [Acidiferrobacteraceae bacterium]
MIRLLIGKCLDNRALVLLAAWALLLLGVLAVLRIPLEAIPDISPTQVIIKTSYPGQAPQVVQDQVTYPIESLLMSVPGRAAVRGYSMFGDSFVYVIFRSGTKIQDARNRVLQYLSQIQSKLPPGVTPALGPESSGVDWIYEYALTDPSGTLNTADLTTLQNWFLKYRLQAIPGVAEVATVGGMVREYQVVVRPHRLAAYGLTPSQVVAAIRNANGETSGSVVDLGGASYMVRTSGYIHRLRDLRQAAVTVRHGVPVLLGNIARIQFGPQLPNGVADLNGQGSVVGGIVMMDQGQNAYDIIKHVRRTLKTLQASLPAGVKVVTTYSQAPLIAHSVRTLTEKLIEESVAVALVSLIFLFRARSALVAILALPLGILVAIIVMWAQNVPANIMSLGGIAIAIGAMVDAAIVMIENMHKHMERVVDPNPWLMAREAATEVGPALFFSLLIIAVSFLPVFTLSGEEGKLFIPLALTKTYSMTAAAVLSVTLVPVLMAYLIRGPIPAEDRNPVNRVLARIYRPIIQGALRHANVVLVTAVLFLATVAVPWARLQSEFMPPLNEGTLLYMPISQDPSLSIGSSAYLLQLTDRILKHFPEVATVFGKAGRAQTATDPAPLSMFETVVTLKDPKTWPRHVTLRSLQNQLNQALTIPGLSNIWTMPIQARVDMLTTGLQTPLGIKVAGPSLTTLNHLGMQVQIALQHMPGAESVYASKATGGRYIVIQTRRLAAARYGLAVADVNQLVETAIGGAPVSTAVNGLERFPIDVRYPRAARQSLAALSASLLTTPEGAQIPLADVARLQIADGPPMLTSDDAQLNNWVYINLKPGTGIGAFVRNAQAALAHAVHLPPGYTLSWVGQYQVMQHASARLRLLIPAVIALVALLLYFNFQNLAEVALILLTLPLSLVGGFWLVYLLGYKLSVAVAVGFIALAGVASEFGVVMLLYLDQSVAARRESKRLRNAEDLREAILEGTLLRLRPMVMTFATVVGGLLPIMFSHGAGADVMKRIAAPMVGGMVSAAALSLVVIPVLYWMWQRERLFGKRIRACA